jgi:hypothetical protein
MLLVMYGGDNYASSVWLGGGKVDGMGCGCYSSVRWYSTVSSFSVGASIRWSFLPLVM